MGKSGSSASRARGQVFGHGLGNDVVRAKGRLVPMLLQGAKRDEDNGFLLVNLFHLKSGKFAVFEYHFLNNPPIGRVRSLILPAGLP